MRIRWISTLALGPVLALLACAPEPEQPPVCEQYTACIRSLDALAGHETDLDRFDPGGACWNSEETAKACVHACTRGLEWEQSWRDPLPEACQ